ncbi:hypothetical protein C2845_PM18G11630 [Panicum miliaceum]|uniref:Stress-associated endoplasmic reticulum protein 2-like n=1 Tax=Panicum miliaceum TaxID=4540 RepID=A0A3L6PIY8_PANMI|nr:hypothetical protein C2845_PM18G11630 [Panicum miliaceum]
MAPGLVFLLLLGDGWVAGDGIAGAVAGSMGFRRRWRCACPSSSATFGSSIKPWKVRTFDDSFRVTMTPNNTFWKRYLVVVQLPASGLGRKRTTSRRLADRKTAKFQKNITRRGSVPETTVKKGNDYPVGPVVLGFFIFVVIGSCVPSDLL